MLHCLSTGKSDGLIIQSSKRAINIVIIKYKVIINTKKDRFCEEHQTALEVSKQARREAPATVCPGSGRIPREGMDNKKRAGYTAGPFQKQRKKI